MTRAQETSSAKISSLMNENMSLSNECNSLSCTEKEQVVGLAEADGKIAKLKVEYGEELQAVVQARDELKKELSEVKASLSRLEDESLQLFEEGYCECVKRFEARGVDVASERWEDYLRDEQSRVRQAVGTSSNVLDPIVAKD
ncbi:uncharacterized protein LOC141659376 [Apium graveolens]|uniref:uncharacterized protein LOC141659376 n=1 Tax=Apium graveolens TaxID=4045 RepID=UPI003D79AACE